MVDFRGQAQSRGRCCCFTNDEKTFRPFANRSYSQKSNSTPNKCEREKSIVKAVFFLNFPFAIKKSQRMMVSNNATILFICY